MSLVTPYGRVDRAAVTERAQGIYYGAGAQMTWGDARGAACREAAILLRSMFPRRVPAVAIRMVAHA